MHNYSTVLLRASHRLHFTPLTLELILYTLYYLPQKNSAMQHTKHTMAPYQSHIAFLVPPGTN